MNTYSMMIGQFDYSNYSASETFFFLITTLILSIILINMIILMMNDSFAMTQKRRILYGNFEKESMIVQLFLKWTCVRND